MSGKIPKQSINFILESSELVRAITSEFYINAPINYFNYVRVYPNGDRITLSDNLSWGEIFLREAPKHNLIYESDELSAPKHRYNIWDNTPEIYSASLVKLAKNDFDLDHGLTVIQNHNNYTEFSYFCAPSKNHWANNYYLNNLDKLELYIKYFKVTANDLIKKAEKQKINFGKVFNKPIIENTSKIENHFSKKVFYLYFRGGVLQLTIRELECLAFKMQGLTAKESALLLKVSHRTVEKYLEVVRDKVGNFSNYKLIKMLSPLDINLFSLITKKYIESYEDEHTDY